MPYHELKESVRSAVIARLSAGREATPAISRQPVDAFSASRAANAPWTSIHHPVLQLQRQYGNRFVSRLFREARADERSNGGTHPERAIDRVRWGVLQRKSDDGQRKLFIGPSRHAGEPQTRRVASQGTGRLARGVTPAVRLNSYFRRLQRRCACGARAPSQEKCEECGQGMQRAVSANTRETVYRACGDLDRRLDRSVVGATVIQRVHVDAKGRKAFDCAAFAGDPKLEACLNDEDRLRPHERGPTVAKVQAALQSDGQDLGPDGADGVYGAATGQAVMAFKAKYHLGFERFPDVGPGTMARLDELCAKPKPGPTPKPPSTGKCFDKIDWPAFFTQAREACETERGVEKLLCQQVSNDCKQFDDPLFVENCVVNGGFQLLVEECGIPAQPPGKAEIRQLFQNFIKGK